MPVCVAGAALCLCACFYGLAGVGCRCVRLSVGVCACLCACGVCAVPVVRPAALCVPVWQVLPCVVLWVSAGAALWSALIRCAVVLGCAFINKNKGLQRFLNEKDYMRFYLPLNFSIISIMSLPLFDYIDYIMSIISVLFNFKKTPPSKSFGSYFFSRLSYGNLNRYKVESINA